MTDEEKSRLKNLYSYHILDSLPEDTYNDITFLASQICNTPIALISLVDENRQWFKSKVGLSASETPREYAFCAHAIQVPDQVMVVEDARKDKRFHKNPLTTGEPHVIFYAGAPLISTEGYALGTLCVIDNKPGQLEPNQLKSLEALSRQVSRLLELRKRDLEKEKNIQKLASKNAELEQFAYITSHDLQEPLGTIKSMVTFLQDDLKGTLDDENRIQMRYMNQSVDRMSRLIKSLLDFSRIGSNGIKTKVDCNEIVQEVLQDLSNKINESKASVETNSLPELNIYRTEFRLLLQNLISNAIKFARKGVSPAVQVHYSLTDNEHRFSVVDNGIGIETDHQAKIFNIFQRLNSHSDYSGEGIGLAHCKKIVEMHEGQIWVESEKNNGSTFYFTIIDE